MEKTVFLSIIVPVYNVSRYIVKCISSILNQDIEIADVEIIIVNDGTPDDSIEKIQTLIDKNDNIRLIVQENKGLSEARNAGLRCATGTYVWFVDSDDWISQSSIKIIKEYSSRFQSSDCFSANVMTVDEATGVEKVQANPCKCFDREITGDKFLTVSKFITPIQKYIFKRDFLLKYNAFFVPNMYHEDVEFTIRIMPHISSMVIIREYLYYYLQRSNGNIMSSLKKKNFEDVFLIIEYTESVIDTYPKSRRYIYYNKIFELCMTLVYIVNNTSYQDVYEIWIKKIKRIKNICINALPHLKNGYKIKCFAFIIFPNLFIKK